MTSKPVEKIAESARGEDRPVDEKRPTIPYVFVALYPFVLVVALLALLAYFYFVRS